VAQGNHGLSVSPQVPYTDGTVLALGKDMARVSKKTRTVEAGKTRQEARPVLRPWTALLAATTLGVVGASMVHADIQSDARLDARRSYRLIVQSYADADVNTLGNRERPVASTQRAVTPDELREGVRVGLLEFRQDGREADDAEPGSHATPLVLAWVEEGKADLELDGLRARPQPGSLLGASPRITADGTIQISVRGPASLA
jgi:hypothetical protein